MRRASVEINAQSLETNSSSMFSRTLLGLLPTAQCSVQRDGAFLAALAQSGVGCTFAREERGAFFGELLHGERKQRFFA